MKARKWEGREKKKDRQRGERENFFLLCPHVFSQLTTFFDTFFPGNDISVLHASAVGQPKPDFAARIQNITVNVGREAILECHVTHLGRYKVQNLL